MKNTKTWEECQQYLDQYLKSGHADIALVNKCKYDAEKRFCISFLYEQKVKNGLDPANSISHLESFLNED